MTSAEAKAEGLTKAMRDLVTSIEHGYLRPLQKEGYLEAAKCCDTAATQEDLQQCVQRCELPVMHAQNTVNGMLQEFSGRLTRCTQRCQDLVQGQLPAQPNEQQITRAQEVLADCFADCASEHLGQLPKLRQDLEARLQQRPSSRQGGSLFN